MTIAQRGTHIVMGCSHIYNSRGEGLQFRLSKIENPIFRRGHPFMSEDDARRVGHSIRQHFFDSMTKLPSRVVIHKRTPFIRQDGRAWLRDCPESMSLTWLRLVSTVIFVICPLLSERMETSNRTAFPCNAVLRWFWMPTQRCCGLTV